MVPHTVESSTLNIYNAANAKVALDTTAGFTGIAQFGIQENTDWVANTYKTIYSHTGCGLILALIGPTAGGAETTTFEITIDGVLSTITITNANGERAVLAAQSMGISGGTEFTSINIWQENQTGMDATRTTLQTNANVILSARTAGILGSPLLRYDYSCLVRMKHSTSITNSIATAYSGVVVRKGITS